jgi:hypothetical protein
MRKGRYRCKRYLLYLPVAIGDQVDRSVDYLVRLFGPAIILVPEGTEFPLSRLENSNNVHRENHMFHGRSSTNPLLKDSKGGARDNLP